MRFLKQIMLIIFLLFVVTNCSINKKPAYPNKGPYKHITYYMNLKGADVEMAKQYFLIHCLNYAYGDSIRDAIFKKDISLGVIWDVGEISYIYKRLDSLAKQKVKAIKPTQIIDYGNKKPIFLRCLEFYDSKELDSLIKNSKFIINNYY